MNILASIHATALFLAIILCNITPQDGKMQPVPVDELQYRIVFYNTENFFDTRDDSLTADDEFTPQGGRHWNFVKYKSKLNNLYKTILALGTWNPPDLIGICEVENKQVLMDLANNTPLSKYNYRIIHANSPDKRGIDVAVLYNSQRVIILQSRYYGVGKEGLFTRDILYCKARLGNDTCHFFINHWPSRSAGQLETEPDRLAASSRLKSLVDSLIHDRRKSKIVIMGDFNDEPWDISLSQRLQAKTDTRNTQSDYLYNLSTAPEGVKLKGTVKFRGEWTLFDQVIVSGSLLGSMKGLHVHPDDYHIFGESFLLVPDEQYNGFKPYRTYDGYKYQGGFSDHLPVYIDLRSDEGRGTRDKEE
jgi:endonuclease/exonuclease/phosphatase family metal-dependent hydrolase